MSPDPQPDFVAAMKALQAALGDNDLAKQVFSDVNAADRQTKQTHFDARIEYVPARWRTAPRQRKPQ